MKFEITRASHWSKTKPCKEAVKEDGKWMIEINSLEELMALIEKYDEFIIYSSEPPSIMIYDDYIE